jgi:hypothetical protein
LIVAAIALAVGFATGGTLGYRYADGRCAAEKVEAQAAAERAMAAASQAARDERAANERQTEEKTRYVQVIKRVNVPTDCRLPDDALGLLVGTVKSANAASAPAARVIECVLLCAPIPEPAGPDMESLSTWGMDVVQRYETCAARPNRCAARLGEDHE